MTNAEKRSPVEHALQVQEKALEAMREEVLKLLDRLEPVLNPISTKDHDSPSLPVSPKTQIPLVDRIDNHTNELTSIRFAIEAATSRLAL